MSAHTYTRGTWTTPEAAHPDRDVASTDFVAAGVVTATTYLKWALLFEEPDSRTLWLAKALPREWLAPTAAPVAVANATSRYGRVSYRLSARGGGAGRDGLYTIDASVRLPPGFAANPPPGGLRLRLRAPLPHARRLANVTVGGRPWTGVDARAETIDFPKEVITAALLERLHAIVATFA